MTRAKFDIEVSGNLRCCAPHRGIEYRRRNISNRAYLRCVTDISVVSYDSTGRSSRRNLPLN